MFHCLVEKKVSQKMLEFGCDLKMEPVDHLERISGRFKEDIEFIISIRIDEYLKRYHYLESHINNEAYQSRESADNIPSIDELSDKESSPKGQIRRSNEVRRRVEAEAVKKEIGSMLNKDMIKKYYLMFTHNMEDILQDLAEKMFNYLSQEDFTIIYELIEIIINNLLGTLSQFYVLVSKNYSEEEYNEFNFIETDKLKQKLNSFFVTNANL